MATVLPTVALAMRGDPCTNASSCRPSRRGLAKGGLSRRRSGRYTAEGFQVVLNHADSGAEQCGSRTYGMVLTRTVGGAHKSEYSCSRGREFSLPHLF